MTYRILHLIAIAFMAFLTALPAHANDAAYFTSGNQLIPIDKESKIYVDKEVLTITLSDDRKAHIDVYYEFYNPSPTPTTITMGFEADQPHGDIDDLNENGIHPYIYDFTVEMNGKKQPFRNSLCLSGMPDGIKPLDTKVLKNTEEYINYSYVYYFTATFQPGRNIVHHTYSYDSATGVGFVYEINYKLSPAMRWANECIKDFTLVISAPNTAKHFVIPRIGTFEAGEFKITSGQGKWRELNTEYAAYYEFSLRNATAEIHIDNMKCTKDQFGNYEELDITSADQVYFMSVDNTPVKLGAAYDRSSALPLYLATEYMKDNLIPKDLKMRERIKRNLPYANRGHVFKDPQLKKYFESLWWYMPDPNYKDDTSDFKETEWTYIK